MLRFATAHDLHPIHAIYSHPTVAAALERAPLDVDEFRPVFADLLQRPSLYVYTVDGAVIGFCHLSRQVGDGAHLSPFAIDPAVHGRGHGRRMLLALIDRARQAGIGRLQLFVSRNNAKALALYQSHGFVIEGGGATAAGSEYYMGLLLAP